MVLVAIHASEIAVQRGKYDHIQGIRIIDPSALAVFHESKFIDFIWDKVFLSGEMRVERPALPTRSCSIQYCNNFRVLIIF